MKVFIPLLFSACLLLPSDFTNAASATWNSSPTSDDWNTAENWTPNTVPNGPDDIATFGSSTITTIAVSADIEVDSIVFSPGASAFTIRQAKYDTEAKIIISGAGIVNNSGISQTFTPRVDYFNGYGTVQFLNSANAGVLTNFIAGGGQDDGNLGSQIFFFDSSSAASGSFTVNGGKERAAQGGSLSFFDESSAANGTFITNGGAKARAAGGLTQFGQTTSADHGRFTINGGVAHSARGGLLLFYDSSSAASATLIANGGSNEGGGGSIEIVQDSDGGSARVELFGDGNLNVSEHDPPGTTIGSLEGTGLVNLGARKLSIGSNSLSTGFSGVIQGNSGSLVKIGTGTLTLTGANTYTGTTTVSSGALKVNNVTGSGTGTGPVGVDSGVLGGTGTIAGAVTVGTGNGAGASLQPSAGANKPVTLTILSILTLNADATYSYKLNSRQLNGDSVVATGVTIADGAEFDMTVVGRGIVNAGTVFTAINNTAATPIVGEFANLPNGSTFVLARNKFQVNYQGGDGNDLTLTVVP